MSSATQTSTTTPVPAVVAELLARTNRLRASLGLPALALNTTLAAAAQNQADWMVSTGMVVHKRPDGSTPSQRAQAAGYPNSAWVSEIIYMGGIATPNDAWDFWTTSAVHYTELTRREHQEVGIGTASSKIFGQAFVMLFGRFGVTTPVPVTPGPGEYVVQPGDTLYQIALRHGVTLEALAAANHIGINDTIYVGQVLVIPQVEPQASPTMMPTITITATISATSAATTTPTATGTPSRTPIHYVVQPGDTLFLIAQRFGVPLDALIAANGITNPDRIEVGQVIIIP